MNHIYNLLRLFDSLFRVSLVLATGCPRPLKGREAGAAEIRLIVVRG